MLSDALRRMERLAFDAEKDLNVWILVLCFIFRSADMYYMILQSKTRVR